MTLKINDNIFHASFDNKLVILDLSSGRYFELNETSAKIYEAIKNGAENKKEILEALSKEYYIDKNLEEDLDRFLLENKFILNEN